MHIHFAHAFGKNGLAVKIDFFDIAIRIGVFAGIGLCFDGESVGDAGWKRVFIEIGRFGTFPSFVKLVCRGGFSEWVFKFLADVEATVLDVFHGSCRGNFKGAAEFSVNVLVGSSDIFARKFLDGIIVGSQCGNGKEAEHCK